MARAGANPFERLLVAGARVPERYIVTVCGEIRNEFEPAGRAPERCDDADVPARGSNLDQSHLTTPRIRHRRRAPRTEPSAAAGAGVERLCASEVGIDEAALEVPAGHVLRLARGWSAPTRNGGEHPAQHVRKQAMNVGQNPSRHNRQMSAISPIALEASSVSSP